MSLVHWNLGARLALAAAMAAAIWLAVWSVL
jgi:hypothetical protein